MSYLAALQRNNASPIEDTTKQRSPTIIIASGPKKNGESDQQTQQPSSSSTSPVTNQQQQYQQQQQESTKPINTTIVDNHHHHHDIARGNEKRTRETQFHYTDGKHRPEATRYKPNNKNIGNSRFSDKTLANHNVYSRNRKIYEGKIEARLATELLVKN